MMNPNSFYAGDISQMETEEERRRRLLQQQQQAAQQRAPKPVKQTITTDPATGEQTVRIEGRPEDLAASNPLTPTVTGPVRPQDIRPEPPAPMPAAQAPAAPVAPAQIMPPRQVPPQQPQMGVAQGLQPPTQPSPAATIQQARQTAAVSPAMSAGVPTQATAGIDYTNILLGSQQDPRRLAKLSADAAAPEYIRMAANEQRLGDLQRQQREQQAQARAQDLLQRNDAAGISRAMRDKSEDGSLFRAVMYRALGLDDLAKSEQAKLAGPQWQAAYDPTTNQRALIQVDSQGRPLRGLDTAGQELAPDRLIAFAAGGQGTTNAQKGEIFRDEAGNHFREVFDPRRPAQPQLVPLGHTNTQVGKLTRATQDPALAAELSQARAGGQVIGTNVATQTGQLPGARPTQELPVAEPGTQTATQISTQTGERPPAAAQGAARPAGPPVVAGTAPVAPVRPGVVSPADFERQQAAAIEASKQAIQTAETEPRENIKTNTALATEASKKARDASSQLSTLDRVIQATENRPEFFGEWIGGEAFRSFREAQTDDARREAFNRLAQAANISKADRPEFQRLVNDIRRLELAGITGSGLSATQLNTERESQRAVGAFAVSITDTAQAAKAQALIAKAGIDYNRAFNQYMGSANKRLSPAALQADFDEKIGDQIYRDLQQRLQTEIPAAGRPAVPAAEPGDIRILNRRPL